MPRSIYTRTPEYASWERREAPPTEETEETFQNPVNRYLVRCEQEGSVIHYVDDRRRFACGQRRNYSHSQFLGFPSCAQCRDQVLNGLQILDWFDQQETALSHEGHPLSYYAADQWHRVGSSCGWGPSRRWLRPGFGFHTVTCPTCLRQEEPRPLPLPVKTAFQAFREAEMTYLFANGWILIQGGKWAHIDHGANHVRGAAVRIQRKLDLKGYRAEVDKKRGRSPQVGNRFDRIVEEAEGHAETDES